MASKGGISGLAVTVAAVGGFLVFAGIKDVPLLDGLREIISGKIPTGREQKRTAQFPEGGVSGTSVPSDPGNYTLGAVQPHVRLALNEIGGAFGIKNIGGFRAGDLDHGRGLAGDVMVDNAGGKAKGDQVAAYAYANRERLGLTYIIWWMRIASASRGWTWRAYSPITNSGDYRHEKHVHLSFKAIHTYRPPASSGPIKAV